MSLFFFINPLFYVALSFSRHLSSFHQPFKIFFSTICIYTLFSKNMCWLFFLNNVLYSSSLACNKTSYIYLLLWSKSFFEPSFVLKPYTSPLVMSSKYLIYLFIFRYSSFFFQRTLYLSFINLLSLCLIFTVCACTSNLFRKLFFFLLFIYFYFLLLSLLLAFYLERLPIEQNWRLQTTIYMKKSSLIFG